MTLVNIDLRNAGHESGPDDRVVFYSLLVREGEFGTISTAPVTVWLEDGQASVDLAPGPVGVQIIAGQVADTRVKIGEVPTSGPTTLNAVMMVTPAYTPALQKMMIAAIERAKEVAVSQVDAEVAQAVDAEVGEFKTKAEQALTKSTAAESKSDTALSKSTTAESSAGNAVSRVSALEAMSGLSPESPVDGQTANLIGQPDTLTRGAVIGAVGASTGIVSVKDFGALGDGVVDDTLSIQSAIDYLAALGGGTVYVPPGTYMIKGHEQGAWFAHLDENTGVRLRDNINFVMDSGATLQAITNDQGFYNILRLWDVHNVSISGGTLRGDRHDHTGTSGEWGYGLLIVAGSNIHVENVTSVDMWGDGFDLDPLKDPVSGAMIPPKNITIRNVRSSNNRRQGMSVKSVSGLYVSDSVFENTSGTAPQCGVDIEPNDEVSEVSNMTFERCRFLNNGGSGLLVIKPQVTGLTVKDCYFSGNLSENGQLQTLSDLTNVRVMDCEFVADGVPGNAILFRGGINIALLRNISDRPFRTQAGTGDGARVRDLVIEGNEIRTDSESTLDINSSTRVTLRGNVLSAKSAKESVKIWDTGQITVIENRIVGGATGLWISGTNPWRDFEPRDYMIRGNIFEDHPVMAMRVSSGLEGCTISENTFRGAGYLNHYGRAIHIETRVTGTKIIGNSFYQEPVEVDQVSVSRAAVAWSDGSSAMDTMVSGNMVVPEGASSYRIWYPSDETVSTGYIGGADGMMRAPTDKRPTAPAAGLIMYDTTLGKLITWDGAEWVNIDGSPFATE